MQLIPGDQITIIKVTARGQNKKNGDKRHEIQKAGTVTEVHKRFITVQFQNYKSSIPFSEIEEGKIKIIKEGTQMALKINITNEQLIKDCKEFGTDKNGKIAIAKKYNLTEKQVSNLFFHRNILKQLKIIENYNPKMSEDAVKEIRSIMRAEEAEESKGPQTISKIYEKYGEPKSVQQLQKEHYEKHPEDDGSQEHVIRINNPVFVDTKETIGKAYDEPGEIECDINPRTLTEIEKRIERIRNRKGLKPKALISQELTTIEYDLLQDVLRINQHNSMYLTIDWEDLDNFIDDLVELKKIVNA